MRRLLVTGGAGFIGANFVHYWRRCHPQDRVVVLDALTYAGNLASLEAVLEDVRFVHGDVCDTPAVEALLREETIEVVVHFAAESHVDRSIRGPEAFVRTNVEGTHSLLMAARSVGVARFHHVSTDEVYGSLGPSDAPFTEATAYAPRSPYAATKAAADHLVRAYHETYGMPAVITNCSNNYGPGQFPEKLVPLMIVNALEGRPLPVYGDGMNVRDWMHVEDHCRGIELALERGRPGESYNLGGRCEMANVELVRLLLRVIRETVTDAASRFRSLAAGDDRIIFVQDRPGHDRRYAVDCSKAWSELGYEPHIPLAEGLRSTVAWYLDNEPWWRAVMDGSYREWVALHYGL